MNAMKYQFLTAIVGEDGARALVKAGNRLEDLNGAIVPRVILAWLDVVTRGDYAGHLPGVESVAVSFAKSEQGFSGSIDIGENLYKFQDVNVFHIAGGIAAALGLEDSDIAKASSVHLQNLGKSIDLLVKSKTVNALAKTSWNVKARRRFQFDHGSNEPKRDPNRSGYLPGKAPAIPLDHAQVSDRRKKYAESLGLEPKYGVGPSFPQGKDNQLPYDTNFDLAHEVGHASMTPPGTSLADYQAWLSDPKRSENPSKDKFQDNDSGDDFNDAINDREEGLDHENTANAAETYIDRRSGVDPHAFQSEFRNTMQSQYDDADPLYHDKSGTVPATTKLPGMGYQRGMGRNVADKGHIPIASDGIREGAKSYIDNLDDGARFGKDGKLNPPTGVDAKVNARAKKVTLPGKAKPMSKAAMHHAGGGGQGGVPGQAAKPIAPKVAVVPTPTQPKMDNTVPGAVGTSASKIGKPTIPGTGAAALGAPTAIKPIKTPKPKTGNIMKNSVHIPCGICGQKQFSKSVFTGCLCLADLAKSVKVNSTPLGYKLTFGTDLNSEDIQTIMESFQGN